MANSSIHIASGGAGYFAHNSRESETVNSIFSDEKNYCSCSKNEAFKIYKEELKKRSEKYTERTKQKLQKNTITHLSAIVNFNKNHTPEDMKKLCDHLEKRLDTKIIQFSMHRDEGYVSPAGEKIKNYHAHIEFLGLDSQGNSVRKKLDKKFLIELQSDTAKILNMERGINYTQEQIKRPKRLDTHEYKAHKQKESKQVLTTQKDLKKEILKLRTELQERGAGRNDYAELEQLNKEFKKQIKAKELTTEGLQERIENLKNKNQTLESENEDKSTKINTLLKQNKSLQEQNKTLNEELTKSEPKITHSSNMDDLESEINQDIKKLSNKYLTKKRGLLSSNTVIAEPKSFLDKVKSIALRTESIIKRCYAELQKQIVEFKKEITNLKEKIVKLEQEKTATKEEKDKSKDLSPAGEKLSEVAEFIRNKKIKELAKQKKGRER